MKNLFVKLVGVVTLCAMSTSATAQFKTSKEFGALMKKAKVGISILDQQFLSENFSTTNEDPSGRSDIDYTYQLSSQHNSLPLHFTLGITPAATINVDDRLERLSTAVGMKPGLEVQHYDNDMVNYFGAKQASYIHASLSESALDGDYFNTSSDADKGKYFKYDLAFVFGMHSENSYVELVVYYDRDADSENEVTEIINRVLTSFIFKEPVVENENFAGIGVAIGQNSKYFHYQITGTVIGGASEKAGVLPGDFIVLVDGQSIEDMDLSRLVNLIRGEINSEVTITVMRGTIFYAYTLTRKPLNISGEVEMKKTKDFDLSKIYFLNTTAYIIENDLTSDDFEDFIGNVEDGKKYKYYLDFPMRTPGAIIKTTKNSRIEYVLYSSKEEEKVKAFYDKLKGYMLGEYSSGAVYKTKDDGNAVSLVSADESDFSFTSAATSGILFAELTFTSTATGFFTVKYIFYKY